MNDSVIRFCEECGCEILSEEDVGFQEVDETSRICLPGIPKAGHEILRRPFVVCRACVEEVEREWEAFTKTPEFEYECAFERWVREFSDETKSATI